MTLGDTSYRVVATKMVNSDADVLMTNTFVPDTTAFLKDLERLGNTKPLLLVDGNDTPVVFDGGPQLGLAVMATYGGNRTAGSAFEKFEKEYVAKFGAPPESLQTALGYDLIMAVAAAVEAAGTFDGPAVRDALLQARERSRGHGHDHLQGQPDRTRASRRRRTMRSSPSRLAKKTVRRRVRRLPGEIPGCQLKSKRSAPVSGAPPSLDGTPTHASRSQRRGGPSSRALPPSTTSAFVWAKARSSD